MGRSDQCGVRQGINRRCSHEDVRGPARSPHATRWVSLHSGLRQVLRAWTSVGLPASPLSPLHAHAANGITLDDVLRRGGLWARSVTSWSDQRLTLDPREECTRWLWVWPVRALRADVTEARSGLRSVRVVLIADVHDSHLPPSGAASIPHSTSLHLPRLTAPKARSHVLCSLWRALPHRTQPLLARLGRGTRHLSGSERSTVHTLVEPLRACRAPTIYARCERR